MTKDKPIVLLDANVLVDYPTTDTLLSVASEGVYEPRWSQPILDETSRAMTDKLNIPPRSVQKRLDAMNKYFPNALVEDFDDITSVISTRDPGDRHVLAAAVKARAETLLTKNGKDFWLPDRPGYLDPLAGPDMEIIGPDKFLTRLYQKDHEPIETAISVMLERRQRTPTTREELLAGLSQALPIFAASVKQRRQDEEMWRIAAETAARTRQVNPPQPERGRKINPYVGGLFPARPIGSQPRKPSR